MSKQRPSKIQPGGPDPAEAGKTTVVYWGSRVFKNTFTREGRRFEVRGWAVKIQHQGRRKTFALVAEDRAGAAVEASELYRVLRSYGWDHVTGPGRALLERAERLGITGEESAKNTAAYWKPRLVTRKYTDSLESESRQTLSIRIDVSGADEYFPLGTTDPDEAAAKALEIYQTIRMNGWAQARLAFARERTVGIFWSQNPFATTYATLFTVPANRAGLPLGNSESRSGPGVFLLEPDPGLRRALKIWLGRQVRIHAPDQNAWDQPEYPPALKPPGMALINSEVARHNEPPSLQRLRERQPQIPIYPYGVFENSDQIFASLSGVTGGYILRRRSPTGLLDPVSRALANPASFRTEAPAQIKRYFQSLFETPAAAQAEEIVSLTEREQQILDFLSKGYLDKEIADNLGISAWTVHGHVKRIFEKFNVHTRTEAVVKYLQK